MRLDQWLVKFKGIPSRTKAQELIKSGAVEVFYQQQWRLVSQASWQMEGDAVDARLLSAEVLKYVSRAGLKLEGAIKHTGLQPDGLRALDIGQSTGGFSDCLLQLGCRQIIGVDVGHDQLHPKIKQDSRVNSHEGINIKNYSEYPEFVHCLGAGFDLVVVDVSFLSLTQVLPATAKLVKKGGRILALVKPQFELGRKFLDKRGIVKDSRHYDGVKVKILACAEELQLSLLDYFSSSLPGADGNQEFFVFLERNKA